MVDSGRIKPLLDETRFGFFEAANDHRRLESGEALGKATMARG